MILEITQWNAEALTRELGFSTALMATLPKTAPFLS
jgi:hypothetical protein